MTYTAKDPNGKVHSITTTRAIGYAGFLKLADGTYHARFSKSKAGAIAFWGVNRTTVARAVAV